MSDVTKPGTEAPHGGGLIRSPKDFWGGLALVVLAGFAIWASSDLPGMRGFAFGPGTAPRLFAYMLMAVGVAVALVGLLTDGPPEEKFSFSGPLGGAVLLVALIPITYYSNRIGHLVPGIAPDIIVAALGAIVVLALAFVVVRFAPRGPVFITAATLIFAVTVRPLGLVIGSFVSLMVSAYATDEIRWIETIIWAAVLTLFCSLLFPYGLNLPLQLWPRF
jgi:putative tricarboxylic transport membrane protein